MTGACLTAAIRDFGTSKEIARVVGCSVPTAARYRRGETMPDPLGLARLMGRSRLIAAAMLRLAGLDDLSMDLEEARLTRELRQFQARRGGPPNADTEAPPGAAARPLVERLESAVETRMIRALADAQRWRRP